MAAGVDQLAGRTRLSVRQNVLKSAFPVGILLLAVLAVGAGLGQPYVEDSIDVGGAWVGSLAYNSRADVVYGRSFSANSFFTIDCATNRVIERFSLDGPWYGVYDSIDNKAYWTFRPGDAESVLVVDGQTHRRLRAIPVDWAAIPIWDPVANRVWVSCHEANAVACIDCASDSIVARVRVWPGPQKMHMNAQRRKLYVQCDEVARVCIIDADGFRVIGSVVVREYAMSGLYCASADKYYCDGADLVSVIDGAGDSIVGAIPLPWGANAWSMAENPGLGLVFLGVEEGSNYHAVQTVASGTDSVVRTLAIPRGPQHLLWSPRSDWLYCACYDGSVVVIAGDGSRIARTLPVGSSPFVQVRSPVQNRVYVGCLNSRWVYVIRDTVLGIEEVGSGRRSEARGLAAWPNPFWGLVSVSAGRPARPLRTYDIDGNLVAELTVVPSGGGRQSAVWDGRDATGREVPPGVYFVRQAGSDAPSARLVKMR